MKIIRKERKLVTKDQVNDELDSNRRMGKSNEWEKDDANF